MAKEPDDQEVMDTDHDEDGELDVEHYPVPKADTGDPEFDDAWNAALEQLDEEELALFDLLTRPAVKLTPKERKAVKKVAQELLTTLKAEKLVRKYRTKKMTYQYIKATWKPGELVEIDVKHVPGIIAGRAYFQYTAIDCASRWRYLRIFEEECTLSTITFLEDVVGV